MTSSSSVQSTYLQSLINYVQDIKPYRTKFSVSGSVTEKYLFSDVINAVFTDSETIETFLGADLLPSSFSSLKVRERLTDSWYRDAVSDGIRETWPLPLIVKPQIATLSSSENFVVGTNEYPGIPGLTKGVLSPTRFDGPAIPHVYLNGVSQQEAIDYFVSKGIFSFDVIAHSEGQPAWIRSDIASLSTSYPSLGQLHYNDLEGVGGTLSNISGSTFEEFVAICTSIQPAILTVYSSSDLTTSLGTVQIGHTFTLLGTSSNLRIQFNFGYVAGLTNETALVGDKYVITPAQQITISPTAPEETWSLIKTNAIGLAAKPAFTPGEGQTTTPTISIRTKFLENCPTSDWTLIFNGEGTYTLTGFLPGGAVMAGYPVVVSLINGCSYKDANLAFTLNPTTSGWKPNDTFTFGIIANPANYKVFGSVSGWQADARAGEWYWNGLIGFKIPQLYMFCDIFNSTISVSYTGNIDTWETTVSNSQLLLDVVFYNGVFYASGNDNVVIASTDGVNWTTDVDSIFNPINSSDILIVESNGGIIGISRDGGDIWDEINTGVSYNLNASTSIPNFLASPGSLVNNLNCIIVVGDYGTIITSTSGMDWAPQVSGTTFDLNSITWSSSNIVVVGSGGTILTSPDRLTWTSHSSGTTENLNDIIFVPPTNSYPNGIFVVVGDGGTVIRSTDGGNTWLNLNPNISSSADLLSVAYGDGTYVAVCRQGLVAKSTDGITWTSYGGKAFNSIAYGNGKFVAVGGGENSQPQFVPGAPVSIDAIPSTYNITFTQGSEIAIGIQGLATVQNTIKGYGAGLITNTAWSDDWASFTIQTITGLYDYAPGDVVSVYVAPGQPYPTNAGEYSQFIAYDDTGYDNTLYDLAGVRNQVAPLAIDYELFPLYHGNGVVIFPTCSVGDTVIIDKAANDRVSLRISGATSNYPKLGAINDWIPIHFVGYDAVDSNLTPTSIAEFSDLETYIGAFSAATGEKMFHIISPRYNQTNYTGSSTLVFDPGFFSAYLGSGTSYSILVEPDQSYGQTIQVKISENLKMYGRDGMDLTDNVVTVVTEKGINPAAAAITEGLNILTTINANYSGVGPAETSGETIVSLIYDFNLHQPTGQSYPSSTTGLTVHAIAANSISNPSGNPLASIYNVTFKNAFFTPTTISIAPESNLSSVTTISASNVQVPYTSSGTIEYDTDINALSFAPPMGTTAPFRIWLGHS